MLRLLTLAVAALATACADELVRRVDLPTPPAAARTAFVARLPDTLWMIDLEAPFALPALSGDAPSALAVSYYDESPEVFGIAPGEVPRAAADVSYVLPANDAWQATVSVDEAPVWEHLDALPLELAHRTITPTARACPQFDVAAYPMPRDPGGAVVMPDGQVIVTDRANHFWRFTRDGLTPLPDLAGRIGGIVVAAPDGELWSFGVAGRGSRGAIDGPAVMLPRSPIGETIVAAAGEVTPTGFAVHTLSARGGIARVDAMGWATWDVVNDQNDTLGRSLARVGPGEVMAVTRRSVEVRRASATRVTTETPDPDATGGYTLVREVPGLGTIAARGIDGQLFVSERQGEWRLLPGAVLGRTATSLAQDGDRVYVGGARGSLMELRLGPIPLICAVTPLVSGYLEAILVPAPGVLVLVSSQDGEAAPGVAWVERRTGN